MSDDKPIDLERVRAGDARLDRARQLHEAEGREPRPVPLDEIAMQDQHTYSLKEAAAIVGMSTQTLRRAIVAGELKAFGGGERGGSSYRISRVELANWWRDRGGGELFEDDEE